MEWRIGTAGFSSPLDLSKTKKVDVDSNPDLIMKDALLPWLGISRRIGTASTSLTIHI
jgi:hypothetical protein